MAEVIVNGNQIGDALLSGVASNKELRRRTKEFIYECGETWRMVWTTSMEGVRAKELGVPHPYETGDYLAHIKTKQLTWDESQFIRSALKAGLLVGAAYNDSRVAHFVEDGTSADKPGSRSPWGPNTPTPAFHCALRTAAIMGGNDEFA